MCQQCQLSAVYAQWRHVYHTDLRASEEREGWPQHYSLQAKRTANVLESRFAVVLDNETVSDAAFAANHGKQSLLWAGTRLLGRLPSDCLCCPNSVCLLLTGLLERRAELSWLRCWAGRAQKWGAGCNEDVCNVACLKSHLRSNACTNKWGLLGGKAVAEAPETIQKPTMRGSSEGNALCCQHLT